MDRFILRLGALFALALAAPVSAKVGQIAQVAPREITSLATGWRFHFGDSGDATAQAGFDDSAWEAVSVPHTWNHLGNYGTSRPADTDNRQGIGWYRLTVTAPPAAKGRRQYLDFAAVSKVSDVWVNGQHMGQHRGAFARFRYDVTAVWKPGQANLIAVRADNSKPEVGKPTGETIPLAGDFFVYGGIYRPVQLITANDVGIDLLDHGGPGVYARGAFEDVLGDLQRFKTVDGMAARIPVVVRLRNLGSKAHRLDVTATVSDAAGGKVASATAQAILKAGASEEASLRTAIANPHLWSGTSDPYAYSVTVTVTEKGKLIDTVTQPLGIRSFLFDPNTGFALNGKATPLHGVSRHQDRMGKGWALSPQDAAEDMALLKELGANTVRMAHYQHADDWANEADKAGLVAWAELPYVTSPGLAGGQGSPELWANAEEQLRELIRQNYNHPSILMWSVGNEVDSAKGFGKASGDPLPLLKHLADVAKAEDPSRPTTFADCCEAVGIMGMDGTSKLAGAADMIGYNRYFGWYMPEPLKAREQIGAALDARHAKHPTLPISLTEWGAGGAVSQHSDNVAAGFLNFMGRPQPEEFQAHIIEANWPAIRDRKFVFASWLWNGFDFVSDLRTEGDSFDLNTKGLVTFDRKAKKDAFYYLKSQWNPAPMIWLAGKRYAARAYPVMEVKAYTSAAKARLTLNGKAIGEVACPDGVCLWPAVALAAGENRAEVSALVGDVAVHDEAVWTGPDPKRGLRIEAGDLAGHLVAGAQFGSDNFVSGGKPGVLNMGGFGSMRMTLKVVTAQHPEFYDYWREGEAFSYALPLPDGNYTVTLHTFQPSASAPATTTMSVAANGKPALAPFVIATEAGGAMRGLDKSFAVTVSGGMLKLEFAGQGGKAVLGALEVAPR